MAEKRKSDAPIRISDAPAKAHARSQKRPENRYRGPHPKEVVRAAATTRDRQKKQEERRGHTVGYQAPAKDPVLAGDPDLTMVKGGITPLSERAQKKRSTLKRLDAFIIVLAVICVVAVFWLIAWFNRPITIKLNGSEATFKVDTPITQVMHEKHIEVAPGNLVSVTGGLLETGKGDAFTLKVNDNVIPFKEAEAYKIHERANIEITNGANVTENYELTYEPIAPMLTIQGDYGSIMYIEQWPHEGSLEIRHGAISGETTKGNVFKEAKNCIVRLRDITPDNDRKVVALTFNAATKVQAKAINDALKKADAKATIFVSGENIDTMKDTLNDLQDSGNQLASLTMSFQRLNTLTSQDLQNDLQQAFDALYNVTHKKSTIIRPPYGQFNASAWMGSNGLVSASILWNQDGSSTSYRTTQSVIDATTNAVQPGNIILVTDGGTNATTAINAVEGIIHKLKDNGYELLTIDELLQTDSNIPKDIASGDATEPDGTVWPQYVDSSS